MNSRNNLKLTFKSKMIFSLYKYYYELLSSLITLKYIYFFILIIEYLQITSLIILDNRYDRTRSYRKILNDYSTSIDSPFYGNNTAVLDWQIKALMNYIEANITDKTILLKDIDINMLYKNIGDVPVNNFYDSIYKFLRFIITLNPAESKFLNNFYLYITLIVFILPYFYKMIKLFTQVKLTEVVNFNYLNNNNIDLDNNNNSSNVEFMNNKDNDSNIFSLNEIYLGNCITNNRINSFNSNSKAMSSNSNSNTNNTNDNQDSTCMMQNEKSSYTKMLYNTLSSIILLKVLLIPLLINLLSNFFESNILYYYTKSKTYTYKFLLSSPDEYFLSNNPYTYIKFTLSIIILILLMIIILNHLYLIQDFKPKSNLPWRCQKNYPLIIVTVIKIILCVFNFIETKSNMKIFKSSLSFNDIVEVLGKESDIFDYFQYYRIAKTSVILVLSFVIILMLIRYYSIIDSDFTNNATIAFLFKTSFLPFSFISLIIAIAKDSYSLQLYVFQMILSVCFGILLNIYLHRFYDSLLYLKQNTIFDYKNYAEAINFNDKNNKNNSIMLNYSQEISNSNYIENLVLSLVNFNWTEEKFNFLINLLHKHRLYCFIKSCNCDYYFDKLIYYYKLKAFVEKGTSNQASEATSTIGSSLVEILEEDDNDYIVFEDFRSKKAVDVNLDGVKKETKKINKTKSKAERSSLSSNVRSSEVLQKASNDDDFFNSHNVMSIRREMINQNVNNEKGGVKSPLIGGSFNLKKKKLDIMASDKSIENLNDNKKQNAISSTPNPKNRKNTTPNSNINSIIINNSDSKTNNNAKEHNLYEVYQQASIKKLSNKLGIRNKSKTFVYITNQNSDKKHKSSAEKQSKTIDKLKKLQMKHIQFINKKKKSSESNFMKKIKFESVILLIIELIISDFISHYPTNESLKISYCYFLLYQKKDFFKSIFTYMKISPAKLNKAQLFYLYCLKQDIQNQLIINQKNTVGPSLNNLIQYNFIFDSIITNINSLVNQMTYFWSEVNNKSKGISIFNFSEKIDSLSNHIRKAFGWFLNLNYSLDNLNLISCFFLFWNNTINNDFTNKELSHITQVIDYRLQVKKNDMANERINPADKKNIKVKTSRRSSKSVVSFNQIKDIKVNVVNENDDISKVNTYDNDSDDNNERSLLNNNTNTIDNTNNMIGSNIINNTNTLMNENQSSINAGNEMNTAAIPLKPKFKNRYSAYSASDQNLITTNVKSLTTKAFNEAFLKLQDQLNSINNIIRDSITDEDYFNINSYIGEYSFVIISGDLQNLGKVEYCNSNFNRKFNFEKNEVFGRSINSIIPYIIAESHDQLLERFLKTSRRHIFEKWRIIFGNVKQGFIKPIFLRASSFPFIQKSISFVGLVKSVPSSHLLFRSPIIDNSNILDLNTVYNSNPNAYNSAHKFKENCSSNYNGIKFLNKIVFILTTEDGFITAICQNALIYFGIPQNIIFNNSQTKKEKCLNIKTIIPDIDFTSIPYMNKLENEGLLGEIDTSSLKPAFEDYNEIFKDYSMFKNCEEANDIINTNSFSLTNFLYNQEDAFGKHEIFFYHNMLSFNNNKLKARLFKIFKLDNSSPNNKDSSLSLRVRFNNNSKRQNSSDLMIVKNNNSYVTPSKSQANMINKESTGNINKQNNNLLSLNYNKSANLSNYNNKLNTLFTKRRNSTSSNHNSLSNMSVTNRKRLSKKDFKGNCVSLNSNSNFPLLKRLMSKLSLITEVTNTNSNNNNNNRGSNSVNNNNNNNSYIGSNQIKNHHIIMETRRLHKISKASFFFIAFFILVVIVIMIFTATYNLHHLKLKEYLLDLLYQFSIKIIIYTALYVNYQSLPLLLANPYYPSYYSNNMLVKYEYTGISIVNKLRFDLGTVNNITNRLYSSISDVKYVGDLYYENGKIRNWIFNDYLFSHASVTYSSYFHLDSITTIKIESLSVVLEDAIEPMEPYINQLISSLEARIAEREAYEAGQIASLSDYDYSALNNINILFLKTDTSDFNSDKNLKDYYYVLWNSLAPYTTAVFQIYYEITSNLVPINHIVLSSYMLVVIPTIIGLITFILLYSLIKSYNKSVLIYIKFLYMLDKKIVENILNNCFIFMKALSNYEKSRVDDDIEKYLDKISKDSNKEGKGVNIKDDVSCNSSYSKRKKFFARKEQNENNTSKNTIATKQTILSNNTASNLISLNNNLNMHGKNNNNFDGDSDISKRKTRKPRKTINSNDETIIPVNINANNKIETYNTNTNVNITNAHNTLNNYNSNSTTKGDLLTAQRKNQKKLYLKSKYNANNNINNNKEAITEEEYFEDSDDENLFLEEYNNCENQLNNESTHVVLKTLSIILLLILTIIAYVVFNAVSLNVINSLNQVMQFIGLRAFFSGNYFAYYKMSVWQSIYITSSDELLNQVLNYDGSLDLDSLSSTNSTESSSYSNNNNDDDNIFFNTYFKNIASGLNNISQHNITLNPYDMFLLFKNLTITNENNLKKQKEKINKLGYLSKFFDVFETPAQTKFVCDFLSYFLNYNYINDVNRNYYSYYNDSLNNYYDFDTYDNLTKEKFLEEITEFNTLNLLKSYGKTKYPMYLACQFTDIISTSSLGDFVLVAWSLIATAATTFVKYATAMAGGNTETSQVCSNCIIFAINERMNLGTFDYSLYLSDAFNYEITFYYDNVKEYYSNFKKNSIIILITLLLLQFLLFAVLIKLFAGVKHKLYKIKTILIMIPCFSYGNAKEDKEKYEIGGKNE